MDYGMLKGQAASNDRAPICMDDGTPTMGLHQTIELRSIWIIDARTRLHQTIELRSIWAMGRHRGLRQTIEKRGLRHTTELRSISVMGCEKGAAPDDRTQILTDYATPTVGWARR